MEFQTSVTSNPPKNLYPCLATITLGTPAPGMGSRRLSGSAVSDDGDAGLMRVISGPRRRTSFGQAAVRADGEPRKSFDSGKGADSHERGTWYWRVQAGVNDSHIILLPLSDPANALLTAKPAPLSHVMPAHSSKAGGHGHAEKESIGDKIKNLFTGHPRKESTTTTTSASDTTSTAPTTATADTDATAVDRIADQNQAGAQLSSSGATDAHAERNWPGVIHGQKLGAVVVSLAHVNAASVQLGGGNKEGSWVIVPINASFPGIGQTSESAPKSGIIKFEFDKDWIGAKGEAEVLHHQITSALENPQPAGTSHFANQNFQLGSAVSPGGGGGTAGHHNVGHTDPVAPLQTHAMAGEVAPDDSVTSSASGKVAGGV